MGKTHHILEGWGQRYAASTNSCDDQNGIKLNIVDNGLIMDMEEKGRKIHEDMENIMTGMECAKGFKCYASGFNNLCHAKDIGIELFVECLERRTNECKFSLLFGQSHLCQCPLRVYLSKKLKK